MAGAEYQSRSLPVADQPVDLRVTPVHCRQHSDGPRSGAETRHRPRRRRRVPGEGDSIPGASIALQVPFDIGRWTFSVNRAWIGLWPVSRCGALVGGRWGAMKQQGIVRKPAQAGFRWNGPRAYLFLFC
jgi:hypothetical protein